MDTQSFISRISAAPARTTEMDEHRLQLLLVEGNADGSIKLQQELDRGGTLRAERATTLKQALELLSSKTFDVVLLDLDLPDSQGLEGLVRLRRAINTIPIVLISKKRDEDLAIMALKRGAQDYLVAGEDDARLKQSILFAIERVRAARNLHLLESPPTRQILTGREVQVLNLLGTGSTNREIADQLAISLKTVKSHISNILQKLAVSDRTKAVVRAIELGLLRN